VDRVKVIQSLIGRTSARTYLEIGVESGECFLQIKAPRKIGVDPKFFIPFKKKFKSLFKNPSNIFARYYEMPSDDFFALKSDMLNRHGLDVVFIDGLHTYGQSLRDADNSLKHLNEGGVIVMHDCNPMSEAEAHPADSIAHARSLHLPGWTEQWCGDVWKTIARLRSTRSDLNVFVLDCDFGLGVITKGRPENMLGYSAEQIGNLSYKDLENNRMEILNLKIPGYFEEFIKTIS
jgi:hypothetical protein